jgi:HD-GYP domain-containing protein (c-di-GMP phosphodiesterase class II)
VHDIGKVGILDSIIGKRSRLSDDEYAYVKRHPIIGAEILQQMEELKCIVPDVRHHHERWDGLGYPDGLRGEQIPIGARIICLADAIDAMLSDRPYRRTLSFTEALGEIERYSGTQFDPKIVAAFFEIVSEQGRDFFKNSAQEIDSAMLLSGVAMSQVDNRYMKKSMLDLQTRRLFNPANQR